MTFQPLLETGRDANPDPSSAIAAVHRLGRGCRVLEVKGRWGAESDRVAESPGMGTKELAVFGTPDGRLRQNRVTGGEDE